MELMKEQLEEYSSAELAFTAKGTAQISGKAKAKTPEDAVKNLFAVIDGIIKECKDRNITLAGN